MQRRLHALELFHVCGFLESKLPWVKDPSATHVLRLRGTRHCSPATQTAESPVQIAQ
jgi:hypothetical protein